MTDQHGSPAPGDDHPPTQLLCPQWLLPIGPVNQVLTEHCLALQGERIQTLLPAAEARARWPDVPVLALPGHALLPGLVNSHGHAAMSLFRGFADDLPLQTWLNERIWPLEGHWIDARFVAEGTELACAEMIASGTTTFSDMYFFPEASAAAAVRSGMRAQICGPVVQFPNAWSESAEAAIHQTLALHDEFRDSDRIRVAFGPHSTYTLQPEHLQRIATLAQELDLCVQIHLHETAEEVDTARQQTGLRPLDTVAQCNLLGPGLQAVHMTQLGDGDCERLAEQGVSVIHCPQSNLKLASGFCPTARLATAGVNLALGTDGAASNNSLSLFREMHVAALLAKAVAADAGALPALDVLAMATLNGAWALGLEQITGSLEPGKAADLVAVDLSQLGSEPVYHPESQLVYAGAERGVSHVWVDGRLLWERGQLLSLDAEAVLARTRRWRDRIKEHAAR